MSPQDQRPHAVTAPVQRELLARVCRRDPAAMEQFFDLYYDRIFAHVARLVRDTHLAEDLTHDVFLRLNRVLDRLDPGRDPAAWVFTVATNVVRDHWRSRTHKEAGRRTELSGAHLEVLADTEQDVEQQLARRQEHEAVQHAMTGLSEGDREVILLRDYEGLNSVTVAEILGLKPDAVRQRHSRAVSRLGELFKQALEADGATS